MDKTTFYIILVILAIFFSWFCISLVKAIKQNYSKNKGTFILPDGYLTGNVYFDSDKEKEVFTQKITSLKKDQKIKSEAILFE